MVTIREATENDVERLLDLYLALDRETEFMAHEPGERGSSVEAMRLRVLQAEACPDGTLLVAENGRRLEGVLEACGGHLKRNRHTVSLVLGVRRESWGQGIGRALVEEAERWARATGKHRLELTVMAHNERAVELGTKAGFEAEGIRRHALKVGGSWVDELAMVKLI